MDGMSEATAKELEKTIIKRMRERGIVEGAPVDDSMSIFGFPVVEKDFCLPVVEVQTTRTQRLELSEKGAGEYVFTIPNE